MEMVPAALASAATGHYQDPRFPNPKSPSSVTLRLTKSLLALAVSFVFALMAGRALAEPLLVVDMSNGEVLYEEDAGVPWHPASLTKLMTALVAFNAVANGRLALDSVVTVSKRALAEPPSKVGLPVDTAMTLEVALNLMIVKSANDIAVAVAERVSGSVENFVAEMNQMASVLGLSATHFVNPNGLDDARQTVSARDLAVLTLAIRRNFPQYASIFQTAIVRLGNINLESNNNLLTEFAGTDGMKTGFICASGLNMVVTVDRNGRQLLVVVLGASSARERGEKAGQLLTGALNGQLRGTGNSVFDIADLTNVAPPNMRPQLCGPDARTYVASQEQAFPYGLEGQPSFLNDSIPPMVFRASTLGRVRELPLPLPRPASAPLLRQSIAASPIVTAGNSLIPLPRPRPARPGG
ncbi:MAG: D-alanyl-D-alanine carboxypeptidase [Hyphomicrobiaceae bacterium]|nr:D-alanyl-D-alanine carboxypeptidase [Hyphomicrobiaceae bacterium]